MSHVCSLVSKRCSNMAYRPLVSFCCGPCLTVSQNQTFFCDMFCLFFCISFTNNANKLLFQREGMDFLLINRAWNHTTCRHYCHLCEQNPSTYTCLLDWKPNTCLDLLQSVNCYILTYCKGKKCTGCIIQHR